MAFKPIASKEQLAAEKKAAIENLLELASHDLHKLFADLPPEVRGDNKAMFALSGQVGRILTETTKEQYTEQAKPLPKNYFRNEAIIEGLRCVLAGNNVNQALLVACKVQKITIEKCKEQKMDTQRLYRRANQSSSVQAKVVVETLKSEITELVKKGYLFSKADLHRSSTPLNLFKRVAHAVNLKERFESDLNTTRLTPDEAKAKSIVLYHQGEKLQEIANQVGRKHSTVKGYVKGQNRKKSTK